MNLDKISQIFIAVVAVSILGAAALVLVSLFIRIGWAIWQ